MTKMMTDSVGKTLWLRVIMRAVFLLFITAVDESSAIGEVIITNLQNVEARYAEYRPVPNSQPRAWRVSGWTKILPGKTARTNNGWIYLEQNQQPITFQNLRRTPCFVNQNIASFGENIPEGGLESTGRQLLQRGYKQVDFQYFEGIYRLTGSAFTVEERRFDIRDSSRSIEALRYKNVELPGAVIRAWFAGSVTATEYTIDVGRGDKDNLATLRYYLQGGYRSNPFDGRQLAKIEGTFTVEFAAKR